VIPDHRPPKNVVIIGTDAGGGTLAWKLAPTGEPILLLERSDYLTRDATTGTPRRCSAQQDERK
jgi:choline dehydrogenase-like flavoprotein